MTAAEERRFGELSVVSGVITLFGTWFFHSIASERLRREGTYKASGVTGIVLGVGSIATGIYCYLQGSTREKVAEPRQRCAAVGMPAQRL